MANLIGGLIFFWIDQYIFTSQRIADQWEVKENILCADCGKRARGYRLVLSENYDRSNDPKPEFRCEACSQKKAESIRKDNLKTK